MKTLSRPTYWSVVGLIWVLWTSTITASDLSSPTPAILQKSDCNQTSEYFQQENGTGTCRPKGLYGADCKTDGHCRSDLHYKCYGSTCSCDSDISIYSRFEDSCVGLNNKSCISTKCVENGKCDLNGPRFYGYGGDYTVNRNYNRCNCNNDTIPTTQGLCLVPFQGTCQSKYPDSDCYATLKCLDGACVCPNEDYQYYNVNTRECFTLVGGPCELGNNNSLALVTPMTSGRSAWESKCTPHATCRATDDDESLTCKCEDGFFTNVERKCELGFGMACTTGGTACRPGLFCSNGRCECKDDLQAFDNETSECLGLYGSLCNESEGRRCINGAICYKPRTPGWKLGGTCVCNFYQGLSLNGATRTCRSDESYYDENGQLSLASGSEDYTAVAILVFLFVIVSLLSCIVVCVQYSCF